MKFRELIFRPSLRGGIIAVVDFPNGWGASIVWHPESYGNERGLYELAVLKRGRITLTSVTSVNAPNDQGVEGWLTPADIDNKLARIAQLCEVPQ